jgi:hypothetical protein
MSNQCGINLKLLQMPGFWVIWFLKNRNKQISIMNNNNNNNGLLLISRFNNIRKNKQMNLSVALSGELSLQP